jgi:hypothetical protein
MRPGRFSFHELERGNMVVGVGRSEAAAISGWESDLWAQGGADESEHVTPRLHDWFPFDLDW